MIIKKLLALSAALLVAVFGDAQFAETEYLTPLFPDITISYAFDADGDADADVAMLSSSAHEVAVVPQTSPGVHHGLVRIPLNNFPASDITAADFNGDGLKELVVYSDSLDQFSMIIDAMGVAQEVSIASGLSNMVHYQFFDYNNDGNSDLIYSTAESIFIQYAQSNWQFAAPVVLLDPPSDFYSFIVGDTDTDTDYDITVGETNQFRVYVRNSQGVYNPGTPLATAGNPVRLFLKNVFGTAHPEVFYVTTAFFWSLNNTSNTFQGNNGLSVPVQNGECSFMSTDLDGDSDLDLMLCAKSGEGTGYVKYFQNITSGFSSATWDFAQTYGGRMQGIDLNGDGNMDFLNQNPYPGQYTNYFYYLRGSTSFAISEGIARNPVFPHHIVAEAGYPSATALKFGDLDGDGDEDMVLGSMFKFMWYENDGSGHFTEAPHLLWQLGTVNTGSTIRMGDFDLDGDLDLAYWTTTFINDGTGNFTTGTLTLPPGTWPCDINNDGYTDYISVTNTQFKTYYGNANGTYSTAYLYNHNYGTLTIHSAIQGDFNGDGFTNEVLFSAQQTSNELAIRLRLNSYPSNFFANTMSSCFAQRAFMVGDFDGDNDDDLKCTYGSSWTMAGNGTYPGNFDVSAEEYDFLFNYPSERGYYTDPDHDGNFDYFCSKGAVTASNSIVWIELDRMTMDQTHVVYNENELVSRVYDFHDLDNDGDEEMIFTCMNGSVGIKENLYNNNFDHSLSIKVFADANENGVFDENEISAEGLGIQIGNSLGDSYAMTGAYVNVPRSVGAYEVNVLGINNSPYELLGASSISGSLTDSNAHDTLYFPVRMLGAELELTSSAAIDACAFGAEVYLGYSNGNIENSGLVGELSWSSLMSVNDWSSTPFVVNGDTAEWSFGAVPAYQDSLQHIHFSWPTDAPSDSLFVRWKLKDQAGNVVSQHYLNLGLPCDPQSSFEVHALNGQGSEFLIGPGAGVTYQYTFNGIAGAPSDVVLQLELDPSLNGSIPTVVASNYAASVVYDSNQGLLVGINDYLNYNANADSAWQLTLHFDVDTSLVINGVIHHTAHAVLNTNEALHATAFHTLYDCSDILNVTLNQTVICVGEQIEINDAANDNETYSWQLGDVTYIGSDAGYLSPDSETTSLVVTTTNDFCSASDTLSWSYYPSSELTLQFSSDDSLLTATPGFSVYDWQLENAYLTITSENELFIDTEGNYYVIATDTNGCAIESNVVFALLTCTSGDFNCDGLVNIIDVQELIAAFGCVATCSEYDIDQNGIITVDDLMILLTFYNP